MSILLALLVSTQPLPFLNRAEMDALVQIETLGGQPAPRQAVAKAQLKSNMNLIGAVCGAAGELADPSAFLRKLSSAYGLSRAETASLHGTCAVYLSGRLDARRAMLPRR